MDKVLHATYHDGNLVLDEKLDTALEGRKFTLILVEDAAMASQDETDVADRKRNFFEKLQNYSVILPEDYKFDREEIHDRDCFHRL